MKDLIIIGSGAMGLAAAYQASKKGLKVLVLESESSPGGMAAHFNFNGISLEKFYHFICKSDYATFNLLKEIGLEEKLIWKKTHSGYFYENKMFAWGDPISLLQAPGLTLFEKIRYGIFAFIQVKRKNWGKLEKISAKKWLQDWCGISLYNKLWGPLFKLKFHEYEENISAAWIWTRIKRIGLSRRSIFSEELGCLEDGTETLVKSLIEAIENNGGQLLLNQRVSEIDCSEDIVKIATENNSFQGKYVISTIPIQQLPSIKPSLPEQLISQYKAIKNIGVVCVVLNLKKKVSKNFWLNISMKNWNIPGIIEFSNLRDFGNNNIVYIPYYMPITNKLWSRKNEDFVDEAFDYIKKINPQISDDDLYDSFVGRLRNSQPICEPGFLSKIPNIQTPHYQLQIADTCFYYPEDRGISESVRIGNLMAKRVLKKISSK